MDSIKTWLTENQIKGEALSKLCADLDDFGIYKPIDLIDLEEEDMDKLCTNLRKYEAKRFRKVIVQLSADPTVTPGPATSATKQADAPAQLSVTSVFPGAGFLTMRHVLVLGSSYSKSSKLQLIPAKKDVEAIYSLLTSELGFTGVKSNDANLDTMETLSDDFLDKAEKKPGLAVFYFSGHGVTVQGRNYLIPDSIDEDKGSSKQHNSSDFKKYLDRNAFDMSHFGEKLARTGSVNVVILDSCRTPTLFSGGHKGVAGRQGLNGNNIEGIFYAYAAGSGREALAQSNQSIKSGLSVFTHHLVQHLRSPFSEGKGLNTIFTKVRSAVSKDTTKAQKPSTVNELEDVMLSDIHLRPKPGMIPCPIEELLPPGISEEQLPMGRTRTAYLVYMALLASQAAYADSAADDFVKEQTRMFARYMHVREIKRTEEPPLFITVDAPYFDTVIVAYRGTHSLDDFITDMKFASRPGPMGIHHGFWERSVALKNAFDAIMDALRSGKHVVVTGHSLGGAVAGVSTLRVLLEQQVDAALQSKLLCITFGAPLLATCDLASRVRKTYNRHFLSFIYKHDAIPRLLLLPKELLGSFAKKLKQAGITKIIHKQSKKIFVSVAKIVAAGVATHSVGPVVAGLAFDAFEGFAYSAGKWYIKQKIQEYEPFGTLLFLLDGSEPVATFNMENEVYMHSAQAYMKDMNIQTASFHDHSLDNYAAFLERMRVPAVAKAEGVSSLQRMMFLKSEAEHVAARSPASKPTAETKTGASGAPSTGGAIPPAASCPGSGGGTNVPPHSIAAPTNNTTSPPIIGQCASLGNFLYCSRYTPFQVCDRCGKVYCAKHHEAHADNWYKGLFVSGGHRCEKF